MSASLDSTLDSMEEIRFRKKHGRTWMELQKETYFTFDELEQVMVIFFKIQKRDDKPAASDLISSPLLPEAGHKKLVWTINRHNIGKAELTGSHEKSKLYRQVRKADLHREGLARNSALALFKMAHFRDVLHTGLGMTDAYMMERVMVALDRGTSPYVTMQTFAKAMSLYLRGTLEERISYAFTCYDLLGEGHLRRETMYQLMKKSLAKSSRDDDVEEAVKELVDIMLKRMDIDLDGVISFQDFHTAVTKTPPLLELLGYCLPERPAVYTFLCTWCPNWGKM